MSNQQLPPDHIQGELQETAVIQGMAGKILETLHVMKMDDTTRLSILTTAWINHAKRMLRNCPIQHFDELQKTMLAALDKFTSDISLMRPPPLEGTDARQGEDGSGVPGSNGKTH